ncbi:MAG: hydrogenobyrinic acid a,c-diamide synthase (glutamine-hydrolyzing) [Actinomycetota bacterium]|nr:hydrogenobyrinic acid a,c-diamide synthase (glutamine-hydrolyzing) [Actinomycetota bacterium]
MLNLPRVTISAPHRSSGKTTLSIGLCKALTDAGHKVQPFKKGPDFIDPMWLSAATDRTCRNLDLFMMGEYNIRESLQRAGADADISIVEGNMGLYDGMEVDGKGSTADVARIIKSPIILIIDASNMTRSIAPLLQGFLNFEPDVMVSGVVLNKVAGARHESKLRTAISTYTDIEVIGAIPRSPEIGIIQRHLGLKPAKEDAQAMSTIESIGAMVEEYVDLDKVIAIARAASELQWVELPQIPVASTQVRIGIAQDKAFTFYYPENLEALAEAGAELIPFSPLHDESLPEVDALYIGGGFPEVFMEELEKNTALRTTIREVIERGMPVYAECGGLMYLSRKMSWDGISREMVGALPCDILMHEKPRGHGYMIMEAIGAGGWFEPGAKMRAHEFHYSEVVDLRNAEFGYNLTRGKGLDGKHDGIIYKNVFASYAHLHSSGSSAWARGFVEHVKRNPIGSDKQPLIT